MPKTNISFRQWCEDNNATEVLNWLIDKSDADRYSYSSHERVKCKCSLGHNFEIAFMNISHSNYLKTRIAKCPYCSGKRVLVGFNDLATTRPDLASEWDYEKNILKPTEVTAGAFKDVWWKCANGHSWKARISARDYRNGCPYCANRTRTSKPE